MMQPILTQAVINKYERWNRECRLGVYRSFIDVLSSNTRGRGWICNSHVTGQRHHLLSTGEHRVLVTLLEKDPDMVAIQEQFALDPRITMQLARELDILHPGRFRFGNGRREAVVMTTDFRVIKRNGGYACLHIKGYSRPIPGQSEKVNGSKRRNEKKFRLEEAYWHSIGGALGFIDSSTISESHYQTLCQTRRYAALKPTNEQVRAFFGALKDVAEKNPGRPAKHLLLHIDATNPLLKGITVPLFRHLIWAGRFPFDMSNTLNLNLPLGSML